MLKRFLIGVSVLLGALLIVVAGVVALSAGDVQAARDGVLNGGRTLETEAGPIEYAISGDDGPPVLVIHGAGGGYDQGLVLGDMLLGSEFRIIAPSRFGYLGTPLPADASLAAQADAYTALLDGLGIRRVAIVGISAGGPSTLEFALRHPDRVSAVVMVSAIGDAPPVGSGAGTEQPPVPEAVYKALLKQDAVFWLLMHVAPARLASMFGVPQAMQAQATPEEAAWLSEFMHTLLPVSARYEGMVHDMIPRPGLDPDALAWIDAPALVIHTADDTLVPPRQAQFVAANIPGAELVLVPDGGHLLLGHHKEIRLAVTRFLRDPLPSP